MKLDASPRRKNAPRPADKTALGYLQWLRGRKCIIGGDCDGKMEAAHVDYAGGKGMATKVADRFAVPLCAGHHAEQHRIGWRSFEVRHKVNGLEAARFYWARWPGRVEWEVRNV